MIKSRQLLIILTTAITCTILTGCNKPKKPHKIDGYVEGNFSYIASPFPGHLMKLLVRRGQTVHKGQPLFQLDHQTEQHKIEQLTASINRQRALVINATRGKRQTIINSQLATSKSAQSRLNLLQKRYQRKLNLYKHNHISKDEIDDAQYQLQDAKQQYRKAQAELKEAKLGQRQPLIEAQEQQLMQYQAQLKQAEWQLQQKTAFAPQTGYVMDTYFQQGEWVAAGHPVLSLLPRHDVDIIFYVPQPMLDSIKLNQIVAVKCQHCKTNVNAKIDYISPQAEYTPPVVYDRHTSEKLSYQIKAMPIPNQHKSFYPGELVTVTLNPTSKP